VLRVCRGSKGPAKVKNSVRVFDRNDFEKRPEAYSISALSLLASRASLSRHSNKLFIIHSLI